MSPSMSVLMVSTEQTRSSSSARPDCGDRDRDGAVGAVLIMGIVVVVKERPSSTPSFGVMMAYTSLSFTKNELSSVLEELFCTSVSCPPTITCQAMVALRTLSWSVSMSAIEIDNDILSVVVYSFLSKEKDAIVGGVLRIVTLFVRAEPLDSPSYGVASQVRVWLTTCDDKESVSLEEGRTSPSSVHL